MKVLKLLRSLHEGAASLNIVKSKKDKSAFSVEDVVAEVEGYLEDCLGGAWAGTIVTKPDGESEVPIVVPGYLTIFLTIVDREVHASIKNETVELKYPSPEWKDTLCHFVKRALSVKERYAEKLHRLSKEVSRLSLSEYADYFASGSSGLEGEVILLKDRIRKLRVSASIDCDRAITIESTAPEYIEFFTNALENDGWDVKVRGDSLILPMCSSESKEMNYLLLSVFVKKLQTWLKDLAKIARSLLR